MSGAAPTAERVSPARRAAFEVLRRVFEADSWADRALPAAIERHGARGRDRALAQRLAYGAVQRRGTSDHLIEQLSDRKLERLDPEVRAALRLGLYELLYSDVPDHAAVDQAVELAKVAGGGRGASLVNAVMRRASRQGEELLGELGESGPAEAARRHSYPEWLASLWWEELGAADALSLMAAGNRPSETALRVNTLRSRPDEIVAALRAAGIDAKGASGPPPLAIDEMIVIDGPIGEETVRLIEAGALAPQSRGSAAVVDALDPRPGERILDLCAAPGMKTTQIAAQLGNRGEVVAVEVNAARHRELVEICDRVGANCVRAVRADAASDDLGGGYDRVLMDPPCSDLGTLASRPDARWRKSPRQIRELTSLQARILARAAAALRPSGVLVYSTCTISSRENEDQVDRRLAAEAPRLIADRLGERYPAAAARDPRFLQVRPDRHRTDGFFIARLRREEG